ncbi:MAG: GAF domain-containing protein [Desulfosarcina sp.]
MKADRNHRRETGRRKASRRVADRQLLMKNRKYLKLLEFAQIITSEINFDHLFKLIIAETNQLMGTIVCSIFLIDDKNEFLRAFISSDLEGETIRISKDQGVAGWVFRNRRAVIVDDPYCDPRFCQDVDKKTGFTTQGILCVPLINRNDECIGTIQILNKRDGNFTDEDQEILTHIANQVTIALENAMIVEEMKAAARAKRKAINHLSHELKTPLAILSAVFMRLSQSGPNEVAPGLRKTIDRGQRNISRLFDIHSKVEDIIHRNPTVEQNRYSQIIATIADFAEELDEEDQAAYRKILDRFSARINSIFAIDEIQLTDIKLDAFIPDLCQELLVSAPQRHLDIRPHVEKNLLIHMDRQVLTKVCTCLLKNAIENTPDEGLIEVNAVARDHHAHIVFHDHGVGITKENQNHIFGGFFHTQETTSYSSKAPFEFNAGGSGIDLLRIKLLAERLGFDITFESTRCRFIPESSDLCPGRISRCGHIQTRETCLASGHSRFSVRFPLHR